MELFKNLKNYNSYLRKHPFYKGLGLNIDQYDKLDKKIYRTNLERVTSNKSSIPAEIDDLIRLHFLVTSRKVTTILEFGVGKSTFIFNDALNNNKLKHAKYIEKHLRINNAFECHSVDNIKSWINKTKKILPKHNNVIFHHTICRMATFNSRICSLYDSLPNICPDLIYIDGPDQNSVKGQIRGISTNNIDRLPMSADLLAIEHFLLPGTLIVIDGRTANARFLKSNLQRDWSYTYSKKFDQHFFELKEPPLGKLNELQLKYCLSMNKNKF